MAMPVLSAQENSAAAQSAETTAPAAPAAAAPVAAKDKPDRSYSADFVDQKASLYMVDTTVKGAKEVLVTLKNADGADFVFTDANGSELTVPKKTKAYKFRVKADGESLKFARDAANAEDWDVAVDNMRKTAYTLVPFAVLSDTACPDGNAMIEFFLSSLVSANRLKEAEAYVMSLPLQSASDTVKVAALSVAETLAAKKNTAKAAEIIERVRINSSTSADVIAQAMAVLDQIRTAGDFKRCSLIYSRLSALPENPMKNQAALWGVFCDIAIGNKLSAADRLAAIKMDRSEAEFSLLQMIKGDLKIQDKKPDPKAALELYSEGVVFGSLSSSWMPELLYKTAMAYKQIKNFEASNEIFKQIETLYPDSSFASLGKKEVVDIKKLAPQEEDEAEDEGDED